LLTVYTIVQLLTVNIQYIGYLCQHR